MTSNPFLSANKQLLSKLELEEGLPVEKGGLTEIYLAAYWVAKPDESTVEIGLMGLRFKDTAIASRAAKAMQPKIDENARLEPHTAPLLIHRGNIVCVLSHSSAVDKDVWSVMVRLVENALVNVP